MIAFACAHCGMKYQVKDEFSGRTTKCPTCNQSLVVPAVAHSVKLEWAELLNGQASMLDRAGVTAKVPLPGSGSALPVQRKPGQRYALTGEIGRGGMGAVLRAFDHDIRREIAVKVLLDRGHAAKKTRFIEEAQVTGQLEHPHIVPVYDLGLDELGHPFMTMKLVRGRSLADVLDTLRKDSANAETEWPLSRLLTIFVSICHALAYAHSRGVIHRDLKPANIMVGDYGEVYVMDWGLAKVRGSGGGEHPSPLPLSPQEGRGEGGRASGKVQTDRGEADLTQDGAIMGTPLYMAPEQALGNIAALDERSDIYSLGAILYEMLALEPPVDKSGNLMEVLMRVTEGQIVPPAERIRASRASSGERGGVRGTKQPPLPSGERDGVRGYARHVPPELSAIAMKALSKEQADRYSTVEELRQDIELYQAGRSVSAKRDSFREQAWKLMKRNKGASIATAVALMVLLLGGAISLVFINNARLRAEAERAAAQQARQQADANYAAFQEAVRETAPMLVQLTRVAMAQQQWEEAQRKVAAAVQADPAHAEARLLKAQVLLALQEFPEAAAELERYLKHRPKDEGARLLLPLCLAARRDPPEGLFALAQELARQQQRDVVIGLLKDHAKDTKDLQQVLLQMYRETIEKAWPGKGKELKIDARGLHLSNLNDPAITDLTPLKGMPLTTLECYGTRVSDLTPLKGMPLTTLHCDRTAVSDLTPLKGMPLTTLHCSSVPVSDLTPLKGMPLTTLHCGNTPVSDLTPLKGMPLTTLYCYGTPVSDLTPLQGMPLTTLECYGTRVSDLTPLAEMKLQELRFTPRTITKGMEVIRAMPSLKTIGISWENQKAWPAAEFWQRYEKGEFK